jgi:hypothetical protein
MWITLFGNVMPSNIVDNYVSNIVWQSGGQCIPLYLTITTTMTYEQGLKLNKAKAKMFTKLVKGQRHTININYSYTVTVEIISVRDPKSSSTYSNFKSNVKVIECLKKVPMRDGSHNHVRNEYGELVYEDKSVTSVTRCKVNSFNGTIRTKVGNELSKVSPMFSIETWNVNIDRVIWP